MKSMNLQKSLKTEVVVSIILILIILASRFSGHIWNFTAVGGAALFAGAYFSKKSFSVFTVFAGLLFSDLVIGMHSQMPAVYISYALMIGLGLLLATNPPRTKSALVTIGGSILFYLVTNIAVWLEGRLYPMTLDGLLQSYIMAVPFFKAQFISDLLSAGILFEIAHHLKLLEKPSAANEQLPRSLT